MTPPLPLELPSPTGHNIAELLPTNKLTSVRCSPHSKKSTGHPVLFVLDECAMYYVKYMPYW